MVLFLFHAPLPPPPLLLFLLLLSNVADDREGDDGSFLLLSSTSGSSDVVDDDALPLPMFISADIRATTSATEVDVVVAGDAVHFTLPLTSCSPPASLRGFKEGRG